MGRKTLQQIYHECEGDYTTLLSKLTQQIIADQIRAGVYTRPMIVSACRVVTPVYPIVLDVDVFAEAITRAFGQRSMYMLKLHEINDADLAVKHYREYGQRETIDDDTVTSTDDATTDTSTDNTYFDPTPQYDVEPTRKSQSDIGQRKRTDDIDRKHIEKAHTDVEYDARTPLEVVNQYWEWREKTLNIWIDIFMEAITQARSWGCYGV